MFCRIELGLVFMVTRALQAIQIIHPADETTTLPPQDDITKFGPETHCVFQSYTRPCVKKPPSHSYYYDIQLKECVSTEYGHCRHAYNNFETRALCKGSCRENFISAKGLNVTVNTYCRFQPDFGSCFSYFPSFYFDINTKTCKGFSYSGCGGNLNRFPNAAICVSKCSPHVKHEPVE